MADGVTKRETTGHCVSPDGRHTITYQIYLPKNIKPGSNQASRSSQQSTGNTGDRTQIAVGGNKQNPVCGKLYRTHDVASSINKKEVEKQKKKKEVREPID